MVNKMDGMIQIMLYSLHNVSKEDFDKGVTLNIFKATICHNNSFKTSNTNLSTAG